jgi:hypothetical protein
MLSLPAKRLQALGKQNHRHGGVPVVLRRIPLILRMLVNNGWEAL